jgi:hypothetical protein
MSTSDTLRKSNSWKWNLINQREKDENLDRLEHHNVGFGNEKLETRFNDGRAKTAALGEDIAWPDQGGER